MPDTSLNLKQRLRRELLAKRRALAEDFVAEASRRIALSMLEWPVYQKAKTVMAYLAMPDEPCTNAIIDDALERGKQVCVPFMRQEYGFMDAARINGLDDLVVGRLNLKMPNPATCKLVRPDSIDLVIAPGVAFDVHGNRLGMGAGYYDRFLAKMPNVYRLGLAWSFQILPIVPYDEHDIRMHHLLTESGFWPVH
ncbi:MAG: yqgN [Firmicutes bacterium]|nr:yqgN [Bacillota bacterium]